MGADLATARGRPRGIRIGIGRSQLAVDLAIEADHEALVGVRGKPHLAAVSRLETHRRFGRNVEPAAASGPASKTSAALVSYE